ncbi:MAG: PEGA domain-containing protein [Candidatus Omnitrophota bacterium]
MSNEQKIRAVLFYLSVAIFFSGLPFILSSALGYKFDRRTFKFTKTGIISVKTQPQGAALYLDSRLLNEKTPATIAELLPGPYHLRIELEEYYPWSSEVNVEPRKVTRLEKIILFPRRPDVKQLNLDKVSYFWMDEENSRIYYFDQDGNLLYRSDLEGEKFQALGKIPGGFVLPPAGLKVSADKEKIAAFNSHQVCVMRLAPQGEISAAQLPSFLNFPGQVIRDVFWHSDSYHLIVVTDRSIKVGEIEDKATPVTLVNLNRQASGVFYNNNDDTLYFIDSQKGTDGASYDNVYKLELNSRANPLNDLIKMRKNAK